MIKLSRFIFLSLIQVKKLTTEAVANVTSENWQKVILHTKDVIEEAWKREGILEDIIDEMIISLGSSLDNSESSLEESDIDLNWPLDADPIGIECVYSLSESE